LAEAGQQRSILVVHDWGAFIGMQLQRRFPSLISHLVVIDVVWPSAQPARLSQLHLLVLLGIIYQYWLILSWVIATGVPLVGAPVGAAMNRLMLLSLRPPASSLSARKSALGAYV
jgi:pimeloyl-ACP methyl ester carboxylesterase